MGLSIKLETEDGEPLEFVIDPRNLLHKLLPDADDTSSVCLRFIDWYGDTTFNYLQMEAFIVEWDGLYRSDLSSEETELLDNVRELAVRCREGRHAYLKFYGD